MRESLCFSQHANSKEELSLREFDRVVAAMKPAITTESSVAPTVPVVRLGEFTQSPLDFKNVSHTINSRAPSEQKLQEKDREIAMLQRQVQDLSNGQRKLEKALSSRDEKVASLEKSVESATQRNSNMAIQLKMARTNLERAKVRALTDHRRHEQQVTTLEQALARKTGVSGPGAYTQQDLLLNPLTGKTTGNMNCNPQCALILKAAMGAQQVVEAKVNESNRLEALCDLLESTFELHDHATAPGSLIQRLEIAVHSAVELLDAILQRYDELDFVQSEIETSNNEQSEPRCQRSCSDPPHGDWKSMREASSLENGSNSEGDF